MALTSMDAGSMSAKCAAAGASGASSAGPDVRAGRLVGGSSYISQQFDHTFYLSNM
ncbi:hypothetical protein [Mycolicibacterium goodii]|uniref:hypothetical protein n=1 Tax=Mycolicibacterium goodii TaxID=134601 RepID=UPI001BDC38A6|nr:hypothetical protein [Mycolicibacterium goodii]MBU8820508.1 hypothetical protein [Mycolicibacterium goodii]MBU8840883.1 hypothetical protein [Mycolicibacterium goodii]